MALSSSECGRRESRGAWRACPIAGCACAAALVILALAAQGCSSGGHSQPSAERAAQPSTTGAGHSSCNGSPRLCDRSLGDVVFAGTHNSYAASTEPGWHFANQRYPIARQLDDGIRALLIDVHFGVADPSRDLVRTDLRAEGADRNKVAQVIPKSALRLADRLAGRVGAQLPAGTPEPYLCHTLCELGAEPLEQELDVIARFMRGHPDQVLMLIVEDYVPPAVIERAFERAGLTSMVVTLDRHNPLPTLGSLIASGRRLVVFAEKDGGSPSWYMPAFTFIQDTPLGARRASQFSCARARGEQGSPLLLINNWIDTFPPVPALNVPIGRAAALRARIAKCRQERGVRGAIVAGDFYQRTDLVKVAEQLNREPPGAAR